MINGSKFTSLTAEAWPPKSHKAIHSISSTLLLKYLCSMLKFSQEAGTSALRRLVATKIFCNVYKLSDKFYHFPNPTLITQVIFKCLQVFTICSLKFSGLSSSIFKYRFGKSWNNNSNWTLWESSNNYTQ